MTGKTVGGLGLYPQANLLDRETALRLWTESNTWFSNEAGKKGQIMVGQLADLAILSADYLSVPEDEIQDITSVLTLLGGVTVHASGDFDHMSPTLPPPMPDWSPARQFGGYPPRVRLGQQAKYAAACACARACSVHGHGHAFTRNAEPPVTDARSFWGAVGCSCWAI